MKTIIMAFTLLCLTISASAHHLTPLGYCGLSGGLAKFQTQQFANNLEVQVRYFGTTAVIKTFNTPLHGSTTIIFDVPQATQTGTVKIQFRYRVIGSGNNGWSSWGDGESDSNSYVLSSTASYASCGYLPVHFHSVKATIIH